jgi:hypothetical protein
MEPLDDRELKAILEAWQAPPAPARMRNELFPREARPWWVRFWRAGVRVPAPLAVCLLLALLIAGVRQSTRPPAPETVTAVTFRELQPVKEIRPRIIRRHYE